MNDAVLNALLVMVRTPHIRAYLERNDPKALEQALAAIPATVDTTPGSRDALQLAAEAIADMERTPLDRIARLLDRQTWSPDTFDQIVDVLTRAGYTIHGPDQLLPGESDGRD